MVVKSKNGSEEDKQQLIDAEQKLLEEDDYSETPPPDIIAFNELRSCADLVRMYKSKQLIIDPDFQRDVVWSKPSQTRFIDSLVKQLPIPSMCISLDYKTEERLMIDGLQRISSIIYFLTDDDWRLSKLEDIDKRITGRTSAYLKQNHYEIYSRVENLALPVTVLRCDYSKPSHMSYLFTIFHRLNTGGNKLSNQEIRNCIYHGPFNDLLKDIVESPDTRNLFDLEKDKKYRFAYEELFLRIFAFSDSYEKYNGKLAKYLNNYMDSLSSISRDELEKKEETINRTIKLIYNKIMDGQSMPKLSKATTEALFVGVMHNLVDLEKENRRQLKARVKKLREDELFSLNSLKEGLAAKDKVIKRLKKSIEIFSS